MDSHSRVGKDVSHRKNPAGPGGMSAIQVKALRDSHDAYIQTLDEKYKQQIDDLQEQIIKMSAHASNAVPSPDRDTKAQDLAQITERDDKISSSSSEKDTLQAALDAAQRETTLLGSRITSISSEADALRASRDAAQRAATVQGNKIASLSSEADTLRAALDAAQREATVQENEIAFLSSTEDTLLASLLAAQRKTAVQGGTITSLTSEKAALHLSLDSAQRKLDAQHQPQEQLDPDYARLEELEEALAKRKREAID